MLDDLFLPQQRADKHLKASDHWGGVSAILTGVAANHLFLSDKVVRIADLVPNLQLPEYPAMPSHESTAPVPLQA